MVKQACEDNSNLEVNLIRVKRSVSDWNMHTVKSIQKKNILMRMLGGIQRAIQDGRGHNRLNNLEKSIQQELSKTLYQEELAWYQQSKMKWLVDGDRNTRFYHIKVVQRRRR